MMQKCRATVPACLGTALGFAALAFADPAAAADQRSFVSTRGVDNPACSIASPCRTFGAAVTATSPGGEVIVLDSGGYGTVTIAKSVSIIAPPGIYAGITVSSGNGVTVATPASSDRIVLAGLTINDHGSSGHGIDFTGAGRLEVARTRIAGFEPGAGLHAKPAAGGQGRLHVVDASISANSVAVWIEGGATAPDTVTAVLERVDVTGNGEGLRVWDFASVVAAESAFTQNFPSGIHTDANPGAIVIIAIDRCSVSRNGSGAVTTGPGTTYMTFTGSTIANNAGYGLRVGTGSEGRLAGTTIAQNSIGIDNGGGVVQSQGNNFIFGNASDGVVPIFVGSK